MLEQSWLSTNVNVIKPKIVEKNGVVDCIVNKYICLLPWNEYYKISRKI